MKLSISNIAWEKDKDEEMYKYISEVGFDGIEIAPTRIFPDKPYERIEEAKIFAKKIKEKYNLQISSIQSIWYGREEHLFKNKEERNYLIEYTKKAIDFANTINCGNLVFGCPKQRNINSKGDYIIAIDFFRRIGEYARKKNVIFAIEPNPIIYNTNFINTTQEAIQLVKEVNSEAIKVNIDLGNIIANDEDIEKINFSNNIINHIHISEPYVEIIKKRKIHKQLAEILKKYKYNNYVSIEMKKCESLEEVKKTIEYIRSIFK